MQLKPTLFHLFICLCCAITFSTCKKIDEFNQDPDIEPLKQGFKTSAAISYCSSLAYMAFSGADLPDNVTFQSNSSDEYSGSGIIYVNVSDSHPLPFNSNIGDIVIAGVWDELSDGGVISIILSDVDLISRDFEFYGIHTVPIARKKDSGKLITVFAEQDIVIGEGSDTLLNLSLSRPKFNLELERLDSEQPDDVFAAVKQNVWFITIEENELADVYDDAYTISGGGQIAEARSHSGGILYHALIKTRYNFSDCNLNPTDGIGFIQNLKAGDILDFDNITLEFRPSCDGKAKVKAGTGEYFSANGRNVNLNLY